MLRTIKRRSEQLDVKTVLDTRYGTYKANRFSVMPGRVNIRYIEISRYIEGRLQTQWEVHNYMF